MNILITGDFVIPDSICGQKLFSDGVLKLFKASDFRVVNLEAPLTDDIEGNKILKTGPHLRSSAETVIPYLNQLKVNLVTLANNHILDYGKKGLNDTLNELKIAKIKHSGAGKNLSEANKLYSLKTDRCKIAILNFAENEWSNTYGDSPGASPLNIIDNVRSIKEAKENHDKVIVIIHGGNEYYHYPSPRTVKQYRFYAEQGADAVISHHTHCVGGYEVYQNVPIFYSLGNFLFIENGKPANWYEGLVVSLTVNSKSPITFDIHPVVQSKETHVLKDLQGTEKEGMLNKIKEINNTINREDKLKEQWEKFVQIKQDNYLRHLSPVRGIKPQFLRRLMYKLGMHKLFFRKDYNKEILNRFRCEAHRDVSLEVLKRLNEL